MFPRLGDALAWFFALLREHQRSGESADRAEAGAGEFHP